MMSVVVMGYNNAATIASAIESLLGQVSPAQLEIVVVTSGADPSAAIVRSRFPEVRLIDSHERLMPGGARNAGLESSAGENLAFLAADCIAMPGWVERR